MRNRGLGSEPQLQGNQVGASRFSRHLACAGRPLPSTGPRKGTQQPRLGALLFWLLSLLIPQAHVQLVPGIACPRHSLRLGEDGLPVSNFLCTPLTAFRPYDCGCLPIA